MYEVSEAYFTALKEKAVKDSISGSITLSDGTNIEVNDSVLLKNSLKITKELCSDNYRIGTFNLGCLKMTIYDDNALGRDYSGAKISLSYKLFTGQDFSAAEAVPLGVFTVEGQSVVRRKNRVTLTAYDNGIFFDIEPSESIKSSSYTAEALVRQLCGYCGVAFGGIDEGLPNSGVTVSLSDGQLQTCRDIIMWAAALLCGYAVIGRDGKLYIISAKYRVSAENSSDIVIDRYITESERSSIYSTDTRAYIKYISAYCEGKVKEYASAYTDSDAQAAPAVYALAKNPLLSEKSGSECDTINEAWLSYIDAFKQRGVNARIFGDPAIDLGDTVRFSGGDVDQRRSIVGVVTAIEWKYRNYQDIICTAAQCGEATSNTSSSYSPRNAKSQTEKRIDGIKTDGVGKNVGNDSEIFNRYSGSNANVIDGAYAAHAEGSKNTIGSGSFASHAEGSENSISSSKGAHAEGNYNSISSSDYSHAEGESNHISDAKWAHAGGYGGRVFADCGFVHGYGARASGAAAAAFGSQTLAAGENQFVAGRGNIEDSEDAYALIIGNGTGVRGLSGFAPSNALTLDWEGNLWVAGKIVAEGGGTGGKTYTAGDGISLTGDKISVKPATKSTLGGVKAGEGIEIASDGTISTENKQSLTAGDGIDITNDIVSVKVGNGLEVSSDGTISVTGGGSGGEYTAGSGIEITDENAINLKQATSSEIGGIVLGDGLEYDEATGKTNTIPNIQQAVIIQEADAKYLLHEYTTVDYIAGNKMCYAGPGNQIISNGYTITAQGTVTSGTVAQSELSKIMWYNSYSFSKAYCPEKSILVTGANLEIIKYESTHDYGMKTYYWAYLTTPNGNSAIFGSSDNGVMSCYGYHPGFAFLYEAIYPPGYTAGGMTFENGCIYAEVCDKYVDASNNYKLDFDGIHLYIGFASEAEYNAAVGLTYEPDTLTQVNETITEI